MEPAERIRAALALERPDRPPWGWWGHTYREEWSPRDLADVTVGRQRTFGMDLVKLQPRACCFAQAFGCTYEPSPRWADAPIQRRAAVSSLDDWASVPQVDATAPPLHEQVEALRQVVDALGPSVPVLQTVFSPLTVAGYLVGEDKPRAARELREHPELVGPALERIARALADFAVRSVEAGAAGIFFAISGYASSDRFTLDAYRRLPLPHDRTVLDAVRGGTWFDVLHLCGPRLHFALASELETHAVSWSVHEPGNPSLSEGRERSGRAVMGGLDHRGMLVRGDPQAAAAEARAAIADAEGAGLILAPGCSVPPEAPEANLRAVPQALEP
ncbi:MAG: uroporphyrinogen decarboxylase family protein [Candidatus Velamenicoccus archaeovorus]